jgi:DNA-binding CsgD family transcriptional regulator
MEAGLRRDGRVTAPGFTDPPPRPRRSGRAAPDEAAALSALVGTVYDAALDPGRWPEAVGQACAFLDCRYGAFGAADIIRSELSFLVKWGYDEEDWQQYLTRYFHKNPFNAGAFRTRPGDVFWASGDPSYASFLDTDFHREWAGPLGMIDSIQGTLDKTATGISLLTCVRHRDTGLATDREIRRMRLLLPHLRRALLIGQTIDLHKLRAAAFGEAMDRLAAGVFLVTPAGGLVHANRSGEAMIATGEPLHFSRGVLAAVDDRAQRALSEALGASIGGDVGIGGSGIAVPLAGRDGKRYVAHVLPLGAGERRDAGARHSAAAAVFIREATIDLDAAIGAATQLYGLTPAEVRVVRAVIEVGGLPAIAALLGTSRSTVKSQLEAIFKKTGTRRQAELVHLISGFESPARLPSERTTRP